MDFLVAYAMTVGTIERTSRSFISQDMSNNRLVDMNMILTWEYQIKNEWASFGNKPDTVRILSFQEL